MNQKFGIYVTMQTDKKAAKWASVKCQVRRRVLIMRESAAAQDNVTWRQPRAGFLIITDEIICVRLTHRGCSEHYSATPPLTCGQVEGEVGAQVKNTAGCCAPLRTETQSGSRRITCGSQVNKASEYRVRFLTFPLSSSLAPCIYLLDFNLCGDFNDARTSALLKGDQL